MKNCCLAILAAAMSCSLKAQELDLKKITLSPPILNSDSVIAKGIKLHDDKKYEEAIVQFEKINENDSSYITAQLELANTYVALKKDSACLAICQQFKNSTTKFSSNFLLLEAAAYEQLNQYTLAQDLYVKGAGRFPYNPKFYHELGICYVHQKKYKEARDYFIKAIGVNRNYTPSHFQLGVLALKQKKIIPAMLSWQYYLLLDNNTQRATQVIKFLEQIGDDNINPEDFGAIDPIDDNDDFSDLESIVKSKAAYNENFKSEVKINFRVLKQIQVVLSKLEYNAGDKGFYNQFYARFFKEMVSKNLMTPYMYYILSELKVEDVDKWMKGNKAKIEALGTWMQDYLHKNYDEVTLEDNGKSLKAYKVYSGNSLEMIGNYDEKNVLFGKCKYFFTKLCLLQSEGSYNTKGEKEGEWKFYYSNQKIKELCAYKSNKLDGDYFMYFENGKVSKHLLYKEGKLEGKQSLYYPNGNIKNVYDYKNDVFEGEELGYYNSGRLKYKVPVKMARYEGMLTYYNENGSVQKTVSFANGNHVGKYTEFYRSSKNAVYSEGNYEEDNQAGEWKYYFDDGKLYMTGTYNKKGLKEGVWKEYDREGRLVSEDSYRDDALEGISKNYYENGSVYEEYTSHKNKVTLYRYYDSNGKVGKESVKQKSEFSFELYNQNGTIKKSGKVIGEDFDGKLTLYNYLGLKTDETEYKNGKKVNKEFSFYTNGKVKEETPIANGRSNGLYTEYFINGKVSAQGYMINGQANGYWFYYSKSGVLTEIKYYVENEKYGWQRAFASTGKLFKSDFVANDIIMQRCYYDTLGKLIRRINYDSCADCTYTIPNMEGKPLLTRTIKNNGLNGAWKNYYPDGKVHKESTFEANLENGLSKYYDPFGNVSLEANYVYDDLTGNYAIYDYKKLIYGATYKGNKLNGLATNYYDDSGKPENTKTYRNDDLNGPVTEFDQEGNVAAILNYKDDWLRSYTYYDESGKALPPIAINKPDMKIETFYKNKKPAISFSLKNSVRDGKLTKYAANGNKMEEINYQEGYFHGLRTAYYASGKLKSKVNYNYGDLDGEYIEYYENGNLKEVLKYINGTRQGNSTYYDQNGKVLIRYFYYDGYPMKSVN